MDKLFHPIGYCHTHGIFEERGIAFDSTSRVDLAGNITSCPKCGAHSQMVPGSYSASQGIVNILLDKSVTREMLLALADIAAKVDSGVITPEQAREKATAISPKFGRLFDPSSWTGEVKGAIAGALLTIIPTILNSGTTTINNNYYAPPAISETHTPAEHYIKLPLQGPVPTNKPLFDKWNDCTALTRIPVPKPRPTK